jgi:hypothetical protein
LLNYTSDLSLQIQASDDVLKQYLSDRFADILADNAKQEAILGSLFYEDQLVRFKKIIRLLNGLTTP